MRKTRRNSLGRPKGRVEPATEMTTLRLEPEVKAEVTRIAREDERTISATLRVLIKEAIAARSKKVKPPR